ncbi:MAG: HAMP domain-containing sensor histidine kinase [Spirochaetia bacterium]|jgi:signal transduction histidine kinase
MGRSRRSAAPAIVSRTDPFRAARRKLTLLYLATLAAILAVLSSALYELHARDVEGIERRRTVHEIEGQKPAEEARPGLAEYLEHLGRSIIIADIITLVIGGGLSYLLAARTLQPIKEAMEAEQTFFANAAHDLRTPLAVMRSEAEVALRGSSRDPDEARTVIESSLEEIRRMSSMVEQMLDLARSGSTQQSRSGSLQPLDLAALASGTTARMARRAKELGIRLLTEAVTPLMIAGDRPALERAVYNILENALAYTPGGGCVTVQVKRDGVDAVLEVVDTGIGIPPEDLPHITEPFFRGDRARGVHAGGAGLGLTIVKTTADEHRGAFQASSRPGGGTTISLRFPAL